MRDLIPAQSEQLLPFEVQNEPPRMAYSVREFCRLVGISRGHFYNLVRDDKIRTVTLGGRRLVARQEAERILLGSSTSRSPAK